MSLLTTNLIDTLKATPEKKVPYYDLFIMKYTLITVPAIISQTLLLPETYDNSYNLDEDIDDLISELPDSCLKLRKRLRTFYLCMGIDIGELTQENEEREFISDLFSSEAKKKSTSNRELILRSLNASTFMNYFFLIESTIKDIYIENYQTNPREYLKSKDLILKILHTKLETDNTSSFFYQQLYKRSKLLLNEENLDCLWSILNFIRNQQAHSNGFYDDKAQQILDSKIEKFCASYNDQESKDNTVAINLLLNKLEPILEQIQKDGYIIFNDSLENLIKNLAVMIMESLYCCEVK
ncbi:hypothetical protein HER17_12730 [Pectobacterium carotovorum]|uniref:hypothetical protein n=1 Tax=Pectobacterium carotovorum TaxID=554 RepID=UPI0001A443F1|nr:hypothetical protein [Pectobacterium carotovorum]QLL93762.1 hypothetical protein HER17_12730 [Pectobacterium carotovorum]